MEKRTTLKAEVVDNTLPFGKLFPRWSKVSGPGDVNFIGTFDALQVKAEFTELGQYSILFKVGDGIKQTQKIVTVNVNYDVKTANSGMRLEYVKVQQKANSTDINWMNRVWDGVSVCRRGRVPTPPTIRLTNKPIEITENGDKSYDFEYDYPQPVRFKFNNRTRLITIPHYDTEVGRGSDVGEILANAMQDYVSFLANENYNWIDYEMGDPPVCDRHHSGFRHNPSGSRKTVINDSPVQTIHASKNAGRNTFRIEVFNKSVSQDTVNLIHKRIIDAVQCHKRHNVPLNNPLEVVRVVGRTQSSDKWQSNYGHTVPDKSIWLLHSLLDDVDAGRKIVWATNRFYEAHEDLVYLDDYCYNEI